MGCIDHADNGCADWCEACQRGKQAEKTERLMVSLSRDALISDLAAAESDCRRALKRAKESADSMMRLLDDSMCLVGEQAAEPVRAMAMAVESLGRTVALRKALHFFEQGHKSLSDHCEKEET